MDRRLTPRPPAEHFLAEGARAVITGRNAGLGGQAGPDDAVRDGRAGTRSP
jgi:hypothetical protein